MTISSLLIANQKLIDTTISTHITITKAIKLKANNKETGKTINKE